MPIFFAIILTLLASRPEAQSLKVTVVDTSRQARFIEIKQQVQDLTAIILELPAEPDACIAYKALESHVALQDVDTSMLWDQCFEDEACLAAYNKHDPDTVCK